MTGVYCTNGHPMGPGERFCGVCGAPALTGAPEAGRQSGPLPQPSATNPAAWWVLGTIIAVAAVVAIVAMIAAGNGAPGETTVAQSSLPPAQPTSVPPASTSSPATTLPADTSTSLASEVTSTSASSDGAATTTTTLPGPATVMNASWETITGGDLAGDGGQDVFDVALSAEGRYVAVGLDGFSAVWTSSDGLSWTQHPQGPEWNGTQLLQVETRPDGTLVAVGRRLGDPHVFAAWTSADGLTWTEQPPATGTLPGGIQQVHDLQSYDGGFVAVGSVQDGAGEIDAAWWSSPDGITWTAHTIAEADTQQMIGVGIGNGIMVAAGWHGSSTGVWRASVGEPFTRIDHVDLTIEVSDRDPTFAGARVFAWDVAATVYGFVAVGADQTSPGLSTAAAWTSADGIDWVRYGNETGWTPTMANAGFSGIGPWTVMDTVVESSGTTIVIGRTGRGDQADVAIWETADGRTWTRGPIGVRPEHQRVHRALAVDGRLIAVGGTGPTPTQLHGAVWVATPAGGAIPTSASGWTRAQVLDEQWYAGILSVVEFNGQGVAAANVQEGLTAWASPDATTWTRLDPPGLQTQGWGAFAGNVVVAGGRAFVVGSDAAGASIWHSEDGTTWAQANRPGVAGGYIFDVIEIAGRFFAAGPHPGTAGAPTTPILWTSESGTDWTEGGLPAIENIAPRALAPWGADGAILVAYDSAADTPALWPLDPLDGVMPRIPPAPELAGFNPWLATTFNSRLLLVGTQSGGGQPLVVVHSSDLQTWERIVVEPDDALAFDVDVIGDSVVVAGSLSSNTSAWVWTSRDLEFWAAAPIEPQTQSQISSSAQSVSLIGNRVVVGGWTDDGGTHHYTVWSTG